MSVHHVLHRARDHGKAKIILLSGGTNHLKPKLSTAYKKSDISQALCTNGCIYAV
jgi:hypothetical protein